MSDPQPLTKKPVTVEGERYGQAILDRLHAAGWKVTPPDTQEPSSRATTLLGIRTLRAQETNDER